MTNDEKTYYAFEGLDLDRREIELDRRELEIDRFELALNILAAEEAEQKLSTEGFEAPTWWYEPLGTVTY